MSCYCELCARLIYREVLYLFVKVIKDTAQTGLFQILMYLNVIQLVSAPMMNKLHL